MPPALRSRVEQALATNGDGPVAADALRAAAMGLLDEAASAAAGRDAALTLLAADALMTYACEAAAEGQPERLGDMR